LTVPTDLGVSDAVIGVMYEMQTSNQVMFVEFNYMTGNITGAF